MATATSAPEIAVTPLSPAGRRIVLAVAFLGWFCAGGHMAITQQIGRVASIDLLGAGADESLVGRWFTWIQCAFLFGAAAGGLLFGWLGDRIGRSKGMALSILTYSAFAGVAYFAQSPEQLALLWFLACLGVGGMWPNGVALVSEAWSNLSRPFIAGVIGTSANIGIFLLATLAKYKPINAEDWRWVLLVGSAPFVLGLIALAIVPESPRWLAARRQTQTTSGPGAGASVFRPPMLWITLVGIVLATTPIVGGWGTANWMNPWTEQVGSPTLRAEVLQFRAITGIIGSLLGGWIAAAMGRRLSYFLVSASSFAVAQYTFGFLVPTDASFLFWVAVLGFISGVYFGWLPLCLPELFPTRVRSTGAGISFNFGRIVTAVMLFVAGLMMQALALGYAGMGQLMSLFFVLGMVAICFAPDTSRIQLED